LAVLVVAVEPDVRSTGLGSEMTGHAVATGRLLEEARDFLDGEEGVAIETRAAVGDPGAVLIEAARESAADLVIVGRRGGDFSPVRCSARSRSGSCRARPATCSWWREYLRESRGSGGHRNTHGARDSIAFNCCFRGAHARRVAAELIWARLRQPVR